MLANPAFFFFSIEIYLTYDITLVSGMQHSEWLNYFIHNALKLLHYYWLYHVLYIASLWLIYFITVVHTSIFFFFFICSGFVIHWNETAMGLHVFPIPIPLPPPSPPAPSRFSQCTRPSNPTSGHTHQGNQIWKRHMHPNVHRSTVYHSQDMEAT